MGEVKTEQKEIVTTHVFPHGIFTVIKPILEPEEKEKRRRVLAKAAIAVLLDKEEKECKGNEQ